MRMLNLDKFGIRRCRKPQVQGGLSSTVLTPEGYVDVTFNRELVRRAGRVLERGIAPHDPAFMELVKVGDLWYIYVRYVNDAPMYRKALLWAQERPKWSKNGKKIKEAKNGETGENHESHA